MKNSGINKKGQNPNGSKTTNGTKPKGPKEEVKEEVINTDLTETGTPAPGTPAADVPPTDPQGNAGESKEEPKEEIIVNEPRKVRAYWHKACANIKESTETTLKSTEHLRLTDGRKTITNPLYKSAEETPDETPTKEIPVYSFKRGNRIYYTIDYTPNDVLRADQIKKKADAEKAKENVKETVTA